MTFFKNKIWLFVLLAITLVVCFFEADGKGDFYIFFWSLGSLGPVCCCHGVVNAGLHSTLFNAGVMPSHMVPN